MFSTMKFNFLRIQLLKLILQKPQLLFSGIWFTEVNLIL